MADSKRNNRKRALTNTERTRRRRRRLQQLDLTEIRIEVSKTEKVMTERTAKALGYDNVTEYIRNENLKAAGDQGIYCSDIAKELSDEKDEE